MKDQLKTEMKNAMRAKDKLALETIRSLLSAIQYEEMAKKTESLSEAQTLAVMKAELKKQQESLEYAEKDNREDTVTEIKSRIACIEKFLPQQMSKEELTSEIEKIKAENPEANLGIVMKELGSKHAGQYDGKLASQLARDILG